MTQSRLKPDLERQSNQETEEFEPSQLELESAKRASGQFVSHWKRMMSSDRPTTRRFAEKVRVPEEEKAGVSFRDVSATIGLIARQSSYFLSRFRKLPCFGFSTGDMPLCSAQEFFGSKKLGDKIINGSNKDEFNGNYLGDTEQRFLKQDNHPMMVDMEEGEEYLRDGLTRFLAHRVGGYPRGALLIGETTTSRILDRCQLSGTNIVMPGDIKNGLMMVRVKCKSSGLRVHSSPAYFLNFGYFGDPSTPDVDGWLLPGRYVFATDGPSPPDYLPDNAVFLIPSQYNPHVKKF